MRQLFILCLVLSLQASLFSQAAHDIDSLTIIHWNDFHAQNTPFQLTSRETHEKYKAGGEAMIAGIVDSFRASTKQLLVLSAGDEFQGTPISSFTKGESQIDLLNMIMPDAMVIGNHEFDYGAASLREKVAKAKFPVLCENLFDSTTSKTFAPPYFVKMVGALKIAILGITAPGLEHLSLPQNLVRLHVLDRDSVVSDAIAKIKHDDKPDLIVVLSHEGLDDDSVLATRHPEIDVIIAGHDHRAVFTPRKVNRSIIVEAGSRGQYAGKLELKLDTKGDSVLSYHGKLIELTEGSVTPDPAVLEKVKADEVIVDKELSAEIGTLKTNWTKDSRETPESNMGDFIADAFRTVPGYTANIGFVNSSGLRKTLDAGPIKLRDIWEINPFGNTLTYFTVHGDTLKQMMDFQAGKTSLQISGMKYSFDKSKPKGARIVSLEVGGKPVDDHAVYSIVSNNFISDHFADYFGFDGKGINFVETHIIDRDMVIDYIKAHPVVTSAVEGRITSAQQ